MASKEDIRDWIQDLRYVNQNAEWQLEHRLKALQQLSTAGDAAAAAIPALIRMYFSRLQAEREQALATLEAIDPQWPARPEALEERSYLIKKLNKDHREANKAVRILSGMGEPVVEPLRKRLFEEADDDFFLAKGLTVLHNIQPPVKGLLPLINTLLPNARTDYLLETITDILGERSDGSAEAIDSLVKLLENKNPRVRSKAIKAIGNAETVDEIAALPLINCLSDKEKEVREEAIHVFSKHHLKTAADFFTRMIDNRGKLLEEDLKAIFEKIKFWISRSAAEDFKLNASRFRDNLSWYNRELQEKLAKPEILLESVLAVLYNRGEVEPSMVEALGDIYQKYNNLTIKIRSLKLLGVLREAKEAVLPILVKSLESPYESVREAGVAALNRLDTNWLHHPITAQMIGTLVEQLDSQSTREASVNTLLSIGEVGIPSLLQHLQGTEKRLIRETLIEILSKFGDSAEIKLDDLLHIKEKFQNAQTLSALNDLIKKIEKQ
ncbi:MAG: HEAT repeat domain-containing protein [Bacteroidota bacterium]